MDKIKKPLHPRFILFRAEMKYLADNGWECYCGTMDAWRDSLDSDKFYGHEEALAIQKERDDDKEVALNQPNPER